MAPVPSIWSGALPAVRRAECREGARLGVSIDTRLAPRACSEAPERAGMATTISQRRPCGLGRHMPPVGTDPRCWRLGGGLRNGVLASPRHRHPTVMPSSLRRATHAPRPRSARAPLGLLQGGGWLPPPPTRTYVYHQRATLKPSALGESGWASCVARASRICTNPPGRRLRHFGGGDRISCYRIRWPVSPRGPARHGELGGVLVSIPRPFGRALYRSSRGRVPFRPPFC